jgi:hypothetical protein
MSVGRIRFIDVGGGTFPHPTEPIKATPERRQAIPDASGIALKTEH